MKKLTKIFASLVAVCALCAVFAFAGCGKQVKIVSTDDGKTKSAVFVASSDVMELTVQTSLADYLEALQEKDELQYVAENSTYGLYITSVNGQAESTDANGSHGWSWMVYTDLVTIEGDKAIYSNAEFGTYEYEGKTLNSASYGISELPCVEGYTYALVYSEWSY